MTKSLISFAVATLVALAPMGVMAQTGVVLSGKGVTPAAGSRVTTVENAGGGASYTPSAIVDPMPSKADGMQNNAKDAAAKQGGGQAAALAALGAMIGVMAATCPACAIKGTCGICAASTIGAAASGLTAGNMAGAKALSNTQKTDVNPTLKPDTVDEFADGSTSESAKKINKALSNSGLKVSPDLKTVTTADGRALNTAAAFTGGAGLNSGELSALKDVKAKAQDAATKAALAGKDATPGDDSSVAAGGGKASSSSDTTTTIGGTGYAVKRDPAAVAGAFTDFNGDKIGVASDSMFSMIKRRYVFEAEKSGFVNDK